VTSCAKACSKMLEDQPWRRFLPDLPPPPFYGASRAILDGLAPLKPQRRISVPEWAAGDRRLSSATFQGKWSNDFAPYMTEPSAQVTSRKYGAVVFAGPARTAKSESLVLNTVGHGIACKPRDMLVVCQTQDAAKQFSERKLAPMLRANTALASRQLSGRGADNLHEKKFAGGMDLQIRWPVIGYFSQNEYFTVLLTDYDRFPDDIDGEGDAFFLARKRVQHAGSLGMVVAESSPGRPIEREDWEPSTPHEAPPCGGILGLFNQGTRGKFYWQCPQCGEWFEPLFERMQWETKGSAAESGRTAFMTCPSGCIIGPERKNELNIGGKWLHERADGKGVCEIDDPAIRDADIVSYWCEGPVAAMQSWSQLVARYLDGKQAFDDRGDENALKATVNLDQGRAHLPMIRVVGDGLIADALKAQAERYPMGIAPEGTRFITLQVDVQENRFVVSAEAWGDELEHWLIDRFDVVQPADVEARRAVDPGRFKEDWKLLRGLMDKPYPVAGSGGLGLLPRAQIIDSAGAAGVTANAYAYYREMRKDGFAGRVFLSKGRGGLDRQRVLYAAPEKVLGTRQKRRTDLRIVQIGTDLLKDEVALSLTRKAPGPNAYHLPAGLADNHFGEFCAEVRTDSGWRVRKGGLRNESFDLAVMARGLMIVLKGEKINWRSPPSWAGVLASNLYAVRMTPAAEAVRAPVKAPTGVPTTPSKPEPVAPRRQRVAVTRSKFLGR
jgi:phage terminase large subunit GpA-like protein